MVSLQILSPIYQEWVNDPLRYGLLNTMFCAVARTLLTSNDYWGTAFFLLGETYVHVMAYPHLVC